MLLADNSYFQPVAFKGPKRGKNNNNNNKKVRQ